MTVTSAKPFTRLWCPKQVGSLEYTLRVYKLGTYTFLRFFRALSHPVLRGCGELLGTLSGVQSLHCGQYHL